MGSSSSWRTTVRSAWRKQVPRTASRSISCSGVRSRSIVFSGSSGPPALAAPGPGVVVGGGGDGDPRRAAGLDLVLDGDGQLELRPPAPGVVGLDGRDG